MSTKKLHGTRTPVVQGITLFNCVRKTFNQCYCYAQIADIKLKEETTPLFDVFQKCLGNAVELECEEQEVELLHSELVGKMFNLRKEDWKRSVERISLNKKGKTSSVTLMLRDELKPIAASQSS